jgi:formiminoglutamase
VESSGDLERDQAALAQLVCAELEQGSFVIVLGGGHETSYGHFLGYVGAGRRVAIQNVDAHPDVRPMLQGRGHSGSPFRQALEHPKNLCASYAVHALQPNAVAASHLAYLQQHKADYAFRDAFEPAALFEEHATDLLATFCLDAVDQGFAPGVSAPSSDGLTPREWLRAAFRAGACKSVSSLDVVELNPRFDRDDQTARLAARTIYEALRGFLTRSSSGL